MRLLNLFPHFGVYLQLILELRIVSPGSGLILVIYMLKLQNEIVQGLRGRM